LGGDVSASCHWFNHQIKSSLQFLRKTAWAWQRVEDWFIAEL